MEEVAKIIAPNIVIKNPPARRKKEKPYSWSNWLNI